MKLSVVKESAVSAEEEMKQMNEMLVEDSISADAMSRELEELHARLRQTDNDRKQKLMEEQTLTMEIGVSCFSCVNFSSLAFS